MAAAGIIEINTGKCRTPFVQHAFEPAIPQTVGNQKVRHESDSDTVDGCIHHQDLIRQRQWPRDVDRFGNAMTLEFPAIERPALEAEADAIVPIQVLGYEWPTARLEIVGEATAANRTVSISRTPIMSCGTASARRMPASKPSATMSPRRPSVTISR